MTLAEMFARGRVGVNRHEGLTIRFRRGVKVPKESAQSPATVRDFFISRGSMTSEQAKRFCPDNMASTLEFIKANGENVGSPNRGPQRRSIEMQA